MKISELKGGSAQGTISGEITNVEEPREVLTKYGKKTRVANATLQDDSGSVTLSLWGDDIDKIANGDKVSIENGWVSEYKGNLQVSPGKYGKMTVTKA